jgi:hypothetical protein
MHQKKICKDLPIFISVISVLFSDGGEQSESSSELLYGENVFLEIGTESVHCKAVALAASYLAYMSIFYNNFGIKNCRASPSSRHSSYKSRGILSAKWTVAWLGPEIVLAIVSMQNSSSSTRLIEDFAHFLFESTLLGAILMISPWMEKVQQ